jgi:hypothetical protein
MAPWRTWEWPLAPPGHQQRLLWARLDLAGHLGVTAEAQARGLGGRALARLGVVVVEVAGERAQRVVGREEDELPVEGRLALVVVAAPWAGKVHDGMDQGRSAQTRGWVRVLMFAHQGHPKSQARFASLLQLAISMHAWRPDALAR